MSGDPNTGPYFGYTPAGNKRLVQLRQIQHHVGENLVDYPDADTSNLPPYNPTINWASGQYSDNNGQNIKDKYVRQAADDTIEKIYLRIHSQDADQIDALQEQWFQVSMVIENLRDSITNEAMSLAGSWKGNAANAFLMQGPGASAKSLDDWYNAAIVNSLGMLYLSNTVRDFQAKMDALYQQYKNDMVSFSDQWVQQHHYKSYGRAAVYVADPKKSQSDQYLNDLRDHAEQWNIKARALQYQMAQGYWQVVNNHLGGGVSGIFEGPTDAIQPDPKYLFPTPTIPNLPNGITPNVPTPPTVPRVTVPNVPSPPTVPNLPTSVPDVPAGPHGGAPNPNATTANVGVPNVDPALLAANPALLGLAGGVPNVGGPNSGLGGMSNLGRMSMPPTATPRLGKGTLGRPQPPPGEEGAGRSPMSPNTLRNKAGKPTEERPLMPDEGEEEFARPSGLNSAPPVLRGRRATSGRPPSFPEEGMNRSGAPARPGSAPPVLNRKRQGGAGQQVAGPAGPVEDVLRPAQPGTSTPILRGTRLGQDGVPEEPEPPARMLRGGMRRPSGVTEPEMASRRKTTDAKRDEEKARVDREFETIRQLLDDEEAWSVATPGGAVLDNTPERRTQQIEPRPTLGGGATG